MTRLVLDCSVAVAWCFEDESDRYVEGVMDAVVRGEALVPCLWHYEVVNALAVLNLPRLQFDVETILEQPAAELGQRLSNRLVRAEVGIVGQANLLHFQEP